MFTTNSINILFDASRIELILTECRILIHLPFQNCFKFNRKSINFVIHMISVSKLYCSISEKFHSIAVIIFKVILCYKLLLESPKNFRLKHGNTKILQHIPENTLFLMYLGPENASYHWYNFSCGTDMSL